MATMVKEKRRDKKKSKEKHEPRTSTEHEQPSISSRNEVVANTGSHPKSNENMEENPAGASGSYGLEKKLSSEQTNIEANPNICTSSTVSDRSPERVHVTEGVSNRTVVESDAMTELTDHNLVKMTIVHKSDKNISTVENTYQDLNKRLDQMSIPNPIPNLVVEELEKNLQNPLAYLNELEPIRTIEMQHDMDTCSSVDSAADTENLVENVVPSAPMLDEEEIPEQLSHVETQELTKEIVHKIQSMPLEEAIRIFGGKEIADVNAMSEREEALVEAGPLSGPEHPLVDLLSTFRSSLIAVERERIQLSRSFIEEEKSREALWRVEKLSVPITEKCACGASVHFTAVFEHAEFNKDRLPVAKMKLEGLLRDVQESYCHHQHMALLAHCQIEELVSETVKSNKGEIREALSLVLQALRLSDGAPPALATALQRWATILADAMLDGRDIRQLLYLLHHLFRQTRSVSWASRVIHMNIGDRSSAATAVALLDLLLARTTLETALECTEETEEVWEEVCRRGGGGAVSDGTLRERDLLAMLHRLPLRDLVARLLLFTHADIRQAREQDWGDGSQGRGVIKACCGVRVLLNTLHRAILAHPHYTRLHQALRTLAEKTLRSLALMHLQTSQSYSQEFEVKVYAELAASFAAGFTLFGSQELHKLPATLLSDDVAKDYVVAIIVGLHDKSPKTLQSLSIELPVVPCEVRIRIISHAAADRCDDRELARIVLEFMFQVGIKRKTVACKGSCDAMSRDMLPVLLAAHSYLHTPAFHMLADLNQSETLTTSSVDPLSVSTWRPSWSEVRDLLDDWAKRCPHLIQHLLLHIDYTPHTGVSLETQLSIASWLFDYFDESACPEWAWSVVRRLRAHRTCWRLDLDAPDPCEHSSLLGSALAVLTSSWGHSIPLICSRGVSSLVRVASSRAPDAVHCLAPLMLVMAHSPESVSLTPQFKELMNALLGSGPSLVQRALGRGSASGADLLLNLMLRQLEDTRCGTVSRTSLLSAWLHALWGVSQPASAALLDAAMLACREWAQCDAHVTLLMQEENAKEHISQCVRHAAHAPLLCESVLRVAHASRETPVLWGRVLDVLQLQRQAGDRIHVDNALKHIGADVTSEELVIYRTAGAVLTAPLQHPSHLTLWRLFFHLYLQRPPLSLHESSPPIGPLFFSGLIKSRTLAQLKKRLTETATYHHNEAEKLSPANTPTSDQNTPTRPSRTKVERDELLPVLSMGDLTGESSESDESSGSDVEGASEVVVEGESSSGLTDLLCYHVAAEKMIREYLRWIEEGDKVRAMPHHADIARFMPQQGMEAAWLSELSRRRPPPHEEEFPLPPRTVPPPPAATPTNLQNVIAVILSIKDRSRRRSRSPSIKSTVEHVNFKDAAALINHVDKCLRDIEALAQEWCTDVSRISALDSKLWEHVSSLRVNRPLPPVKRACANKCKPITVIIPHREWCISQGAVNAVTENRRSALVHLRRLARARPHAARTAATLHATARNVRSLESACRVAERAWRCAGVSAAGGCAPAHLALTQLLTELAEKWLCCDVSACCELLSRWGGRSTSALQQALCGALVRPRHLPAHHWTRLYTTLLKTKLPPHTLFSYLSKFEMDVWSRGAGASPAHRRELLDALAAFVQKFGADPPEEHHVLLELAGVHTRLVLSADELCAHVVSCARASARTALWPTHWVHVTRAANTCAQLLTFDQLGHLLRELGVVWWEARAGVSGGRGARGPLAASYAHHTADLLRVLMGAFVHAATALSYAPERVSLLAWSAALESWGPWVTPHPAAPPLLPCTVDDEPYTPMLRSFVDTLLKIMTDCPGTEQHLLQQIFEWTLQTHAAVSGGGGVGGGASQESRVQMSAMLAELERLPWTEHQWIHDNCLQAALQICPGTDKEISVWCGRVCRGATAGAWLRGCADAQLPARLYALFCLFTTMPIHEQTISEAGGLPWSRLPDVALQELLERFFVSHHSPAHPYHDLTQFRLVLYASELMPAGAGPSPGGRAKRTGCVSQWVRAACSPALRTHAPAHAVNMLRIISDIAPYLESSEGEIEELLSRAAVMMCMEPAADAVLPVWESWVAATTGRMVAACLSAAASLTAFEYFGALCDAAARAHLNIQGSTGWSEVRARLRSSPWTDPCPLAARGRLHAAYGTARAHHPPHDAIRTAMLALLAANLHFMEDEVIISLWICYACRVAGECGVEGEEGECRSAALSLLARWGSDPRRSLLQVVTLQEDTAAPTKQHRLLCRLAQCIISNSDAATRSYEAACIAALGSSPGDVLAWGRTPTPKRLPRLAIRLYPNAEKYFQEELDLVNDS